MCSEANAQSVSEGLVCKQYFQLCRKNTIKITQSKWISIQINESTSHNCMQGKLWLSVSSLHLKSWCFQLSEHHPSELRELNTLRNNMVNQGSSCKWNAQHCLEDVGHLTHGDVQGTTYHEWQEPSKNAAAQNFTCQNNKGKKMKSF